MCLTIIGVNSTFHNITSELQLSLSQICLDLCTILLAESPFSYKCISIPTITSRWKQTLTHIFIHPAKQKHLFLHLLISLQIESYWINPQDCCLAHFKNDKLFPKAQCYTSEILPFQDYREPCRSRYYARCTAIKTGVWSYHRNSQFSWGCFKCYPAAVGFHPRILPLVSTMEQIQDSSNIFQCDNKLPH